MVRPRRRFCARCRQRTRPDAQTDAGRCGQCYGPYQSAPRVLPFPAYRRPIVLRSDDDDGTPPEAA